jgi:hypothetical protein
MAVQSSDAISADAGYCSPREACVAARLWRKGAAPLTPSRTTVYGCRS